MTRRSWTPLRRAKLFDAHDGICHICGQKIRVGERWDVEHLVPLALGGDDNEENCRPAHELCHRGAGGKTSDDRRQIAKAERVRAKHIGAHRPKTIMPGSRASKFKRKVNGEVVLREP